MVRFISKMRIATGLMRGLLFCATRGLRPDAPAEKESVIPIHRPMGTTSSDLTEGLPRIRLRRRRKGHFTGKRV